jgi:asparagine synthase (glutamine-hydrolysing)
MCGIAGIIELGGDAVSPPILQRMTDAIAHRGPDGEGHWIEGPVGFGHRRLAIIDLSPGGHQPMISADHRFVITYNGEIYNFRELRAELQAAGYWFRSQSDTEVLLHALAHWGTDVLARLNGMFALGLWDRKERKLLLARDRYGVKPLYVATQGGRVLFASEQKAILAHPQFQRKLDKPALLEYFTFQNIFTDRTLLEDIQLLPAGHFATLEPGKSGARLERCRYWDYRFREPDAPRRKEEYVEELNRLFK